MKSNVDNLESEMSRLTQNIGKIATSSSAIHSSLGGKREKIRQLNGVHSLLTKVHDNITDQMSSTINLLTALLRLLP